MTASLVLCPQDLALAQLRVEEARKRAKNIDDRFGVCVDGMAVHM
jgi:hypothetical protein